MIDYQSVTIQGLDFSAQGSREVFQNLKTLYTTAEESVPFDREFGINTDFLDAPITIARGRLTQQYIEKTRKYEPRAEVVEVHFDKSDAQEKLKPRVVINIDLEAE